MSQLGFDRPFPPVQFSPLGVDHGPLGLRNLLRAILVKQVNGKVFHHVAEEVFLRPSAEQTSRVPHRRSAKSRADQADLMPTGGQLADLPHPQPALAVSDPTAPLGKLKRDLLTAWQRRFNLRELGGR